MQRRAVSVALGLTLLTLAAGASADAALPDTTTAPGARLDVQAAVAETPFGSTRWSRLTVEGPTRVMWLVPARPGAAIDWAADSWLEALDDASALRLLRPTSPAPCSLPTLPEQAPSWTRSGAKRFPTSMTIHTSEGALRDHAGQRGFDIRFDLGARITGLFASGWALAAFEVDTPNTGVISTPTLRVSDDGAASLPFALTGAIGGETRMTVFTLTTGAKTTAQAKEIDPASLVWAWGGGANADQWSAQRDGLLKGSAWFRESSSHEVVFDGVSISWDGERVAPLMKTYFAKANGGAVATCEDAARAGRASAGVVGRACALGVVAKIPGGTACTPASGAIDPAAFTCGSGVDDLALALAGNVPSSTFVTRLTGRIGAGSLGQDAALVSASARPSASPLGTFASCPVPAATPLTPPPPPRAPMPRPAEAAYVDEPPSYVGGESCGTSGGGETYYDDGGGCSAGTDSYDDSEDDGTLSGDTGDDSSSSGDDESSDEESDETTIEWGDDESSDDSDDSDGMAPQSKVQKTMHAPRTDTKSLGKKKTSKNLKKRSSSPISRMALFLGAIVLPFRRRTRAEEQSL